MTYTWVQDRTGANVIHRTGCAHLRMDPHTAGVFDDLELARQEIAVEQSGDPECNPADWVAVAPCAR